MPVARPITTLTGDPTDGALERGGAGILEIVEDHCGDTYRAVSALHFADVVYVLHAFQKKSKQGIKTPQTDVKLIAERLMEFLTALNQDVEIMIRPRANSSGTGHISVLAAP